MRVVHTIFDRHFQKSQRLRRQRIAERCRELCRDCNSTARRHPRGQMNELKTEADHGQIITVLVSAAAATWKGATRHRRPSVVRRRPAWRTLRIHPLLSRRRPPQPANIRRSRPKTCSGYLACAVLSPQLRIWLRGWSTTPHLAL